MQRVIERLPERKTAEISVQVGNGLANLKTISPRPRPASLLPRSSPVIVRKRASPVEVPSNPPLLKRVKTLHATQPVAVRIPPQPVTVTQAPTLIPVPSNAKLIATSLPPPPSLESSLPLSPPNSTNSLNDLDFELQLSPFSSDMDLSLPNIDFDDLLYPVAPAHQGPVVGSVNVSPPLSSGSGGLNLTENEKLIFDFSDISPDFAELFVQNPYSELNSSI